MVLLVHPDGSKYWRLRYRFGGKEKMLALGKYPEVSLADARARRDEARKVVANGVDPSEKKKADKIEQSEALTFESVARDWHMACKRKWSDSHSERVLKSLEDNLFSSIGKRKIAELKTKDLLVPIKIVEASERLEVAARLQQCSGQQKLATALEFSKTIFLIHSASNHHYIDEVRAGCNIL
jgi:hypothetical protein